MTTAQATDWPQYLGPNRDGVYPGQALTKPWPDSGPAVVWTQTGIGAGFSGLAVAGGKAILFHQVGQNDVIECLDAKSGETLWRNRYASDYVDGFGVGDGPRATPTIQDDRVYTMGAQGIVICADFKTGKTLWTVDTQKEFQAPDGFFGMACSPLVDDNAVLLNIGGRNGAGIVALHKADGKLLWKTLDDEASYSSPVMANLAGRRRAVFFARTGLAVINPANGRIDFKQRWRARIHASVNAAAPLVVGDLILVTSSYNTGALVVRAGKEDCATVWSGDRSISSQYSSCVHKDGFVYGLHGRADLPPIPALRCIELASGKVRWSENNFGDGLMVLAGNRLAVLLETGELVLGEVDPAGFREISRAQVAGSGARSQPALAGGFLFARSKNRLVCLDVR